MKVVDFMNKKILIIVIVIFSSLLITIGSVFLYQKYKVAHAVKIVNIKMHEVEVYSDVMLSDLITSMNGHLIKDKKINTDKLGSYEVVFDYINDDDIKVNYSFSINVVDKRSPMISKPNVYNVNVNYDGNIEKDLFCGDNYDDNPKCYIEGEYDISKIGKYNVTFVGIDSSNNESRHNFVLNVRKKPKSSTSNNNSFVNFSDLVEKYKTDKTKMGIDISHWQGNIDFQKVKEAGVEFVYIRVGRGNGIGGEYVIDKKFEKNIEGFNKVGIPVGVYFYSFANSVQDATEEAKWVLQHIKNYDVDLEIVFDWENWSSFQEFDLSFKKLTNLASSFGKVVKNKGYQAMLYSSKNYLENVWYPVDFPVWLAHYTDNTDYSGEYKVWQLCNNGRVDGIDDNLVDIDIMYE